MKGNLLNHTHVYVHMYYTYICINKEKYIASIMGKRVPYRPGSHIIIIEQPHSVPNTLPVFILSISNLWLYSPFLLELGHFFNFLILYTAGRSPWTGDQPVARPPPTHRTAQTQNKRTQTSMP
jgi:hypothetical protein